jgi:hypothetical protein
MVSKRNALKSMCQNWSGHGVLMFTDTTAANGDSFPPAFLNGNDNSGPTLLEICVTPTSACIYNELGRCVKTSSKREQLIQALNKQNPHNLHGLLPQYAKLGTKANFVAMISSHVPVSLGSRPRGASHRPENSRNEFPTSLHNVA